MSEPLRTRYYITEIHAILYDFYNIINIVSWYISVIMLYDSSYDNYTE